MMGLASAHNWTIQFPLHSPNLKYEVMDSVRNVKFNKHNVNIVYLTLLNKLFDTVQFFCNAREKAIVNQH